LAPNKVPNRKQKNGIRTRIIRSLNGCHDLCATPTRAFFRVHFTKLFFLKLVFFTNASSLEGCLTIALAA
jgi:hypothetical protein